MIPPSVRITKLHLTGAPAAPRRKWHSQTHSPPAAHFSGRPCRSSKHGSPPAPPDKLFTLDAKIFGFDTKFLGFDTKFITFTHVATPAVSVAWNLIFSNESVRRSVLLHPWSNNHRWIPIQIFSVEGAFVRVLDLKDNQHCGFRLKWPLFSTVFSIEENRNKSGHFKSNSQQSWKYRRARSPLHS